MSNHSTNHATRLLQRIQDDEAFRSQCETVSEEELLALLASEGYAFTKAELVAVLEPYARAEGRSDSEEELTELDEEALGQTAGGGGHFRPMTLEQEEARRQQRDPNEPGLIQKILNLFN